VEMKQGKSEGPVIFSISKDKGKFNRREMPADNSCLFHAMANLFGTANTSGSEAAQAMRNLAADIVNKNPSKYTNVILGAGNKAYQSIVQNSASWGGAIELGIFSDHFKSEIVAFDYKECQELVYGAGKGYVKRVFLLYSGEHYDILSFSLAGTRDQSIFGANDLNAWERARSYITLLYKQEKPNGEAKSWDPLKPSDGSRGSLIGVPNIASSTTSIASSATSVASSATERTNTGGSSWQCLACTLLNSTVDETCSVCGVGTRPV